jgi:hypothetical protein
MKALLDILLRPFRAIREHIRYKKRIKELRKRDPFIYK